MGIYLTNPFPDLTPKHYKTTFKKKVPEHHPRMSSFSGYDYRRVGGVFGGVREVDLVILMLR